MAKFMVRDRSGSTIYAREFNSDGQVWNTDTEAYENLITANLADYKIPLSPTIGDPALYLGSIPDEITGYCYEAWREEAIGDVCLGSETILGVATAKAVADELEERQPGIWGTPTPESEELCNVEGYLLRGNGLPAEGEIVKAYIKGEPQESDTSVIATQYIKAQVGPNGYFVLQMYKGKTYQLEVISAGIDQEIEVPDASNVNWLTLITAGTP